MKNSIRLISLVLVFSMLVTMLSGCFNKTPDDENPGNQDNPGGNIDTTHTHSFSNKWESNGKNHWHACESDTCSEKTDVAEHNFGDGVVITEGDVLVYTRTCTFCGYQKSEDGYSEVSYGHDEIMNAVADGAISLAKIDTATKDNKIYYFQNLYGAGSNTFKVRVPAETTVSFILDCHSTGSRGTYSKIFGDLKINGSSDGVTYTEGSPTFSGWDVPLELTVATLNLKAGVNEVTFTMGANVNISAVKFTGATVPIFITAIWELDPPEYDLAGKGSESSPWLISCAEEFAVMADWIEYDRNYADDYYKLTKDVDFKGSEVEFYGISSNRAFSGTFDGDGHVIKNLYIDNGQNNNSGLFCSVSGGTIKNLGIESGMIEGGNYVGSLVGNASKATVLNCFNESTVRGNNDVGGLVGTMTESSISNSFNKGLVRLSGKQSAGGLIGSAQTTTISNCYNIGRVGIGTYTGKIIGWTKDNMTFENVWYDKEAAIVNQPVGSLNEFDGIVGITNAELISREFVNSLNANLEEGYMTWSYGNDKIARLSVFEENAKISAFIASIDSVSVKDGKVQSIVSDDGVYKTVVYGSDNRNVIALDGTVYEPLTAQNVLLILDVVEVATGEVVGRVDRNIEVTIDGKYNDSGANEMPDVLPSLREWYGLEGSFKVTNNARIVVDDAEMNEMSERIQSYFKDMFALELEIVSGQGKSGDIVLKYNPDRIDDLGDEGNVIEINDKIIIESATETGMLYGAISIMQIMQQSENGNTVPKGYVRDYPAYEVRGGMIEVSRKMFSLDYVEEIGKYMSWFKLNTLHLHINEKNGEMGAAFVVESKKYPELNASAGEFVWSQDDYRQMQKDLKEFGVNVVTEIDSPGHARVFGAIDSSVMNGADFDLAGHYDEALALIKSIYDEFLDGDDPVFQSTIIHMGTDESSNTSENMRRYMSDLSQYLLSKENVEKVVFWGNLSLYYGETEIDPENVITQIWDGVDYRVDEALDQGFEVINSNSNMLYCVPSHDQDWVYGTYFAGYADIATFYDTWKGGSDFNTHNLQNPRNFAKGNMYNYYDILMGNPKILGAMFALWNDGGLSGNDFDILELILPWMVNVAERCWYGDRDRFASGAEFKELFNRVGDYAAYANPRYRVESDSDIIASYDFETLTNSIIIDSANGYDATVTGGTLASQNGSNVLVLNGSTSLKLPFNGVGYPYTASFDIYLNGTQSSDAILFECDDCIFYLNYESNGVTFQSGRWIFSFNVEIPTDEWVKIKITSQSPEYVLGADNITLLTINNESYIPTCIMSTNSHSISSVLGTKNVFAGINGYVDNFRVTNEYDPTFAEFSFSGEGTEESPYLIQNSTDLQMFAKLLNVGAYSNACFKLTQDIDMNGVEYVPVKEFKGTLDGDGHVIKNLTISQSDTNMVGLISMLDGGTIKNLGIIDSTISGNKWVGAFVGKTMNAVIMNCFTDATVTGTNGDIGGLVGMFNSSKMYNCYSFATVSGTGSVGGLVGSVNSSLNLDNLAELDNVYSFATVTASKNVGIVAGYDEGKSVDTPVTMSNIYYCGDKNASGNYAARTATKLTEAQLTDGTLLDYLNNGVKDGYATWVADENGYPVFLH